jgi:hypothetical protein
MMADQADQITRLLLGPARPLVPSPPRPSRSCSTRSVLLARSCSTPVGLAQPSLVPLGRVPLDSARSRSTLVGLARSLAPRPSVPVGPLGSGWSRSGPVGPVPLDSGRSCSASLVPRRPPGRSRSSLVDPGRSRSSLAGPARARSGRYRLTLVGPVGPGRSRSGIAELRQRPASTSRALHTECRKSQ